MTCSGVLFSGSGDSSSISVATTVTRAASCTIQLAPDGTGVHWRSRSCAVSRNLCLSDLFDLSVLRLQGRQTGGVLAGFASSYSIRSLLLFAKLCDQPRQVLVRSCHRKQLEFQSSGAFPAVQRCVPILEVRRGTAAVPSRRVQRIQAATQRQQQSDNQRTDAHQVVASPTTKFLEDDRI